jgi:hypothetical protein
VFGSTYIYATATNREGTEIRNCEFKFETASGAGLSESPKIKNKEKYKEEEKYGGGL